MQLGQAFGQHRDIGGADLEQSAATERAAAAALKILRLACDDRPKKRVGSVKDLLVGPTTDMMTILFPLW